MARKKGRIQDVAAAEALAKEGQMSETTEDTGLAAEDTIFAAEDTGLATKDIVPTTGKESVVPPLDEIRAEPAPPSSVEETIVETSVDPVAGILEAALAEDFEVLEELGKEGLKAAKSAARIVSKAEPLSLEHCSSALYWSLLARRSSQSKKSRPRQTARRRRFKGRGQARFEGMAGAPKAPGAYGGGLHKGKR